MKKIENVLFTTDFSENAQHALPFAVELVRKCGGVLKLLHVYDVPLMAPANKFTSREDTMDSTSDSMESVAHQRLEELAKSITLPPENIQCIVAEGHVVDGIMHTAEHHDIDIIVMGTKGESAEAEFFIGSQTKALIGSSYCPILAIPIECEFKPFDHIVFSTDLEHDETNILNYLIEFAKFFDSEITVLHIDVDESTQKQSMDDLRQLTRAAQYKKVSFNELVERDPVEGIFEFMDEHPANLLAMTRYKRFFFDRLFHRSATAEMISFSNVPMLIMNRREHDQIFF